MTETMILRAERMVRHSHRYFLRLCAFCERPVGLATAPVTSDARCEHEGELLRLARERAGPLGRPEVEAPCPDPDPTPRRGGRARRAHRSSASVLTAA